MDLTAERRERFSTIMRNMRERSKVQYKRAQRKLSTYEKRDRNLERAKKPTEINFFADFHRAQAKPPTPPPTRVTDEIIDALETNELTNLRLRILSVTRAKPDLWQICFID